MKKFIITLFLFTALSSALLYFYYNYSFKIILYHLLVISFLYGIVFLVNCLLAIGINNTKGRSIAVNVFNYLFFFFIVFFYILVIGSNHFWYKTITLRILSNYIKNIPQFFDIIPVQKWIIISLFLLIVSALTFLFYFVRPKAEKVRQATLKFVNRKTVWRLAAITVIFLAGVFLFRQRIIELKRVMQYNEEPFLQFTLGNMSGEKNEIVFDKVRYQYGLLDKACTDSLDKHTVKPERPVVIILIDALRNDHLPMYGYDRNTTPFLDSLYHSNSLRVVKNAFSTSTNTIGGVASLFYSKDWLKVGFNGLSLMKMLKTQGYKTYAYLTGFHRDWYGLSAIYRSGCDYYYESSLNIKTKTDDDLITLEKLQETDFKENSFIYLHLLSVHMLGTKHSTFEKFTPFKMGIGAGKKESLVNNYDNGILQADYVIRQVFKKLEQDQLLNKATIFILADHGESFGENGNWGHGGNVRESVIRIPLLIYDQDISWYKNDEVASLKDVAPTIAARINYPVPGCWTGRPLNDTAPVNSQITISSVEKCDHPEGLLIKKDSSYLLQIFNSAGKQVQTEEKTLNGWMITTNRNF